MTMENVDYRLDGNGSLEEVMQRVDAMFTFEREKFAIDFTSALRAKGATDAMIVPRLEAALRRWDVVVGPQHSKMREEIAAWIRSTPPKRQVH